MTAFVCQRCQRRLVVDESLYQVDDTLINTAKQRWTNSSPATRTQPPSRPTTPASTNPSPCPVKRANANANATKQPSLVSVNPPDYASVVRDEQLAERRKALLRMFELASDATKIDHPLCCDCIESISAELDHSIELAEGDQQAHIAVLGRLERSTENLPDETEIEQEILRLQEEERVLRSTFHNLERQRKTVKEQIEQLTINGQKLELIEQRFWSELNDYQSKYTQMLDDEQAMNVAIEHMMDQLDALRRTNVFNDAFYIWYDGHFGTINGLRLGYLKSQPVPWDEINAAWGQTALLAFALAVKLRYKFRQHAVIPLGSQSKVLRIEDNTTLELFGSDEVAFVRLVGARRFDNAMVAFLACVKELGEHVTTIDPKFQLHYRIDQNTVGEFSVRRQFNDDKNWTKALKHLLINLKSIISWAIKHEASMTTQ